MINHALDRRVPLIWTISVVLLGVTVAGCKSGRVTASSAGATSLTSLSGASALALSPSGPNTSVPTPTPMSSSKARATAAIPTGGGVVNSAGAVLPNPSRTPGAVNPAVTQGDIGSTICVAGWTATIRPPSSVTTALKEQQLATGYAYRGDLKSGDYEEDHLVSLELGGAPDSPLNLWPEPYNVTGGAHTKDQVENKLHSLVCSGALSLAAAQHAIETNWYLAYERFVASSPAPAVPTVSMRPATTHAAPTPPATTPPAVATTPAPAPCYPLTNSGHCYEPGEFCRASDHGATGVAGDGERITCEDKDGWRWVPTG